MKKCSGCGCLLQDTSIDAPGYTPDISNELCQRCFKLKNYNVLTNGGIRIDNELLLRKINESKCFVLFLTDFFNINNKVIKFYEKIIDPKMLVITKSDIIPSNLDKLKILRNIKDVYNIEDIIYTSIKEKENISVLSKLISSKKEVLFTGFSNAGKSSLINTITGSDITVSKSLNTTQDFIKINMPEYTIVDAPGFLDDAKNLVVTKKINPKTIQLKHEYSLRMGNVKINVLKDTNLTLFITPDIEIRSKKETNTIKNYLDIPKNSDIYLNGLGFIRIKNECFIFIDSSDYEIRPSIIGSKS